MTAPNSIAPDDTAALPSPVDAMLGDELIAELATLLADERIPDWCAESVRAQLREHVYQLKMLLGVAA